MRRLTIAGLALVVLSGAALLRPGAFTVTAQSSAYAATIPVARDAVDRGVITFAFGDWDALSSDTLRTSASPWKLVNAALALQQAQGDPIKAARADIPAIYRGFGFATPERFGNWPQGLPRPAIPAPLGQNTGLASTPFPPLAVTIANIGCPACHAGVMYDATGMPDPTRVWLGAPNTSINLEVWTRTLFTALRDQTADTDRLFATLQALYPDTGLRERLTLRWAILPALRKTIAERDAAYGGLLPFRASLAGATNGLDSLRNRLGLIPDGDIVTDSTFNSIPDLGGRLWRTKLLNAGSYAIPGIDHSATLYPRDITAEHRQALAGIIAYFTVPSMGVTPEVALSNIPDATVVTAWMETYRPPPFPGPIDASLLPLGQSLYATHCASCHGTMDDNLTAPALTSFPNWEGDVGTDPARTALLTPGIAAAVNDGLFGQYITARTVQFYTAPPLVGLWSSAPYLHNGSVPTLWHLMHPDARPVRFSVGGHRLDLARVGIDLDPPASYVPWSTPAEVDTTAFGQSATGHEVGFDGLSEGEKAALLEYLKGF